MRYLQRIQYAKKDSDIIAKMKGQYQERPKKPKKIPAPPEDPVEKKKKKMSKEPSGKGDQNNQFHATSAGGMPQSMFQSSKFNFLATVNYLKLI